MPPPATLPALNTNPVTGTHSNEGSSSRRPRSWEQVGEYKPTECLEALAINPQGHCIHLVLTHYVKRQGLGKSDMFQCLLNVYCGAGLGSTLVHTALFNLDLGDRYYDPHSTRDDVETWSKSELSKVIQLERPGLSLASYTARKTRTEPGTLYCCACFSPNNRNQK